MAAYDTLETRTAELIAIGAATAVNCHDCLRYHVAEGRKAGLEPAELAAAVEVGKLVNRGAAKRTATASAELLGDPDPSQEAVAPASRCCG